ncbi:acetoacetate ligase [Fusarium phyllophilum]|uniref:Acetoacetate ligase n=1 Tax=Fusarium phyllophilum TaxID=47803 RepID=A0A8H5I933_9HYPO|nr:acetoacetate ligase [Fusarium phyllophilum]
MQNQTSRPLLSIPKTFWDLHEYALARPLEFWSDLFGAANLVYSGSYEQAIDKDARIDDVPRWFKGVSLNFAENILFSGDINGHAQKIFKEDDKVAITEIREGLNSTKNVSWRELRSLSGQVASALYANGVRKGDRIVAISSNSVETLLVFLGTTWLGGIFSSSSTDMGVEGILQRTRQISPKASTFSPPYYNCSSHLTFLAQFIFMDDAAVYNGKTIDLCDKMGSIVDGMEGCDGFHGVVSIPRFAQPRDIRHIAKTRAWSSFLDRAHVPSPPFCRIAFHEPMLICYSSGTTGNPKAIVHSVGGLVLNYFKEGGLHENQGPGTISLQYTTTGWIMYFWSVATLLFGARAVLYDGSPFQPDPKVLLQIAEQFKVTRLGISPRWMNEVAKHNIIPRQEFDLSSLEEVNTTGMVLSDQLFEWFYRTAFPSKVHLANMAGGTDPAGCFGAMNPLTPVYAGGTQGPSLGIDVAIFDTDSAPGPGREVPKGTPGELVVRNPFPNVPVMFWGDALPVATPGSKFHSSYFAHFDHVWTHGDFCVIHPVTGNISFLGRSDGVLNPSGVRFGSADIYSVIERGFADSIADSICVGQRRPIDNNERVLLFVQMKPDKVLDEALKDRIKKAITEDLSKRHVPAFIFETPDIPVENHKRKEA